MFIGSMAVDLFLLVNVSMAIIVLIEAAISWYFLFEIRSEFAAGGAPLQ